MTGTSFGRDPENPEELLWNIEHDPDSFTRGRRNDDMVNWVLAKIMVLRENGTGGMGSYMIQEDWDTLYGSLTNQQKDNLEDYIVFHPCGCRNKVQDCWNRYHRSERPEWYLVDQGGYKETYRKEGK